MAIMVLICVCYQVCEKEYNRIGDLVKTLQSDLPYKDARLHSVLAYARAVGVESQNILKLLLLEQFAFMSHLEEQARWVAMVTRLL